jgi:hypothetical protein
MRTLRIASVFAALSFTAFAIPRTYSLSGLTFNDGGRVSGSFVFDADAGTPCSTHASPCGVYSNVNVVTTTGTARSGATYTAVCGTSVPSCVGVSPDSTGVLMLTSTAADQTGLPAFAIFFTAGGGPPAGLSDAGIVSINFFTEASCNNSTCTAPAPPQRFIAAAGSLSVPALSTWGLVALAIMLAGIAALRMRKAAGLFVALFALALCTTMIVRAQSDPKPQKAPQTQPKKSTDTKKTTKDQTAQPNGPSNPWRQPPK